MDIQERSIKALREIVPGADNLMAMREFYENTLGFEALQNFENLLFFRIASVGGGRTQFLVLFDESAASVHRLPPYRVGSRLTQDPTRSSP